MSRGGVLAVLDSWAPTLSYQILSYRLICPRAVTFLSCAREADNLARAPIILSACVISASRARLAITLVKGELPRSSKTRVFGRTVQRSVRTRRGWCPDVRRATAVMVVAVGRHENGRKRHQRRDCGGALDGHRSASMAVAMAGSRRAGHQQHWRSMAMTVVSVAAGGSGQGARWRRKCPAAWSAATAQLPVAVSNRDRDGVDGRGG